MSRPITPLSQRSISSRLSKSSRSQTANSKKTEQIFSDQELTSAVDEMLQTKKAPPENMVHQMTDFINVNLRTSVNNRLYDDADKYERAKAMLIQLTDPCSKYYQDKMKRETALQQYEYSKQRLAELTEEWDKTIANAEQMIVQKVNALKEVHEMEIEKFQTDWETPEFLAPFNKPSYQLLKLRDMEKRYGMAKNFQKAKETRAAAEKLEIIEVQQQREKAMQVMNGQFDQLLIRHKKEVEVLVMRERQTIDDLKSQKKKDLLPFEIKIAKYESEHEGKEKIKPIEEYIAKKPMRPLKNRENIHTMKETQALPLGSLKIRGFVKSKMKNQNQTDIYNLSKPEETP
ncbi:hypothetical protein TRFO_24673 [Tritrichomonas foetus]|uniref:Uncharacterized protein n=1 Tax=Tritrichomonas foetus TaxID=1144522 RepID=A0A1J4K8G1_9EUKA|nr:hypothetical protein TRFO_24673 [Tritrichomonas foetus]|eukprot:OHT07258.1 hypothetical protein TRFO_24673 [Tritrichomonas foetus]